MDDICVKLHIHVIYKILPSHQIYPKNYILNFLILETRLKYAYNFKIKIKALPLKKKVFC